MGDQDGTSLSTHDQTRPRVEGSTHQPRPVAINRTTWRQSQCQPTRRSQPREHPRIRCLSSATAVGEKITDGKGGKEKTLAGQGKTPARRPGKYAGTVSLGNRPQRHYRPTGECDEAELTDQFGGDWTPRCEPEGSHRLPLPRGFIPGKKKPAV